MHVLQIWVIINIVRIDSSWTKSNETICFRLILLGKYSFNASSWQRTIVTISMYTCIIFVIIHQYVMNTIIVYASPPLNLFKDYCETSINLPFVGNCLILMTYHNDGFFGCIYEI